MAMGRVLVVDDDEATADFIWVALTDEGYTVTIATNGEEALMQAIAFRPNLILLDMRMPVRDGRAFVETYRRTLEPHAPIIAMSASKALSEQAQALGVVHCLLKPFDLSALLDCVERYIERE
jgi:CheY-like chemotaxis protein